jgi:hypothetical protein
MRQVCISEHVCVSVYVMRHVRNALHVSCSVSMDQGASAAGKVRLVSFVCVCECMCVSACPIKVYLFMMPSPLPTNQ